MFTAPINNADLFRAYLSHADFTRAPFMQEINLSGADLAHANLTAVNLIRADLGHADLSRANMTGADVSGANLRSAKLTNVTMPTCLYDKTETPWPEGFMAPPHPLGEVPDSSDGGPARFHEVNPDAVACVLKNERDAGPRMGQADGLEPANYDLLPANEQRTYPRPAAHSQEVTGACTVIPWIQEYARTGNGMLHCHSPESSVNTSRKSQNR